MIKSIKLKKNKLKENESGITLIALVITIIILLILAGISITGLLGENGIIKKAESAVILTEKAEIDEALKFAVSEINIKYFYGTNRGNLTSFYTDYIDYTNYDKFVKNSSFNINVYQIESYEVAGENINKYVDISIYKKNGTGNIYRYIIKLGQDANAESTTPDSDIEEKLAEMENGEVSELKSKVTTYAINYVLNGGTNPEGTKLTYTVGKTQTYPIPTYEGHSFEGWYEKSDFSGERVQSTNKNAKGDITIYAKWIDETPSDYFTWTFTEDIATITGFSKLGIEAYNEGKISNLVIPAKYNGKEYSSNIGMKVKSIGNSAFNEYSNIKKLVIGNNVTTIGEQAFGSCTGIIELVIPISTNAVNNGSGRATFQQCTNISKIIFTKGTGEGINYSVTGDEKKYTETPWYISKDNEITVTFEEGITSIGEYMFYNCTGLKEINFPNSLVNIGKYVFNGCTGLTKNNIEFPENLESIGEYAFYNCTNITGELKFPDSMKSIENSTFAKCSSITKVVIGEGLTTLGTQGFEDCIGITELVMPISTNAVNNGSGHATFIKCTNISKITLTKGKGECVNYTTSGETNYKYTPWYISRNNEITITLEEGITSIGEYMFYDCIGLKEINFPNSLVNIGQYAFYGCTGLTKNNIEFSENLETIGKRAFYNCTNITGELKIPNKIKNLEEYTFGNCSSITKVVIGDGVTTLGEHVFDGCTGITELVMPISTNAVNNGSGHATFIKCTNISKITLTKGTGKGVNYTTSGVTNYKYTPWYISKANNLTIIIEEGVNSIGSYTFKDLTDVTFYYTGLEDDWKRVTIGENNTSLDNETVNYNYSE